MAHLGLQSSHFDTGGKIPAECSCVDGNLSPNLRWYGAPEGTQSFVLVVDDPDAPEGLFTHWLVYDIPSDLREVPPARPGDAQIDEGTQGMNDFGAIGYTGPCPPAGEEHRYYFRLYALDGELGLGPGADRNALMQAMQGHILEQTELIARFGTRTPAATL